MKALINLRMMALLTLILPLFLFSSEGWAKGGHHKIFKELNLSQDQKDQLKEIKKAGKEKVRALRESKKALREKLKQAMNSNTSDSDLRKIHADLQKAEAEMKNLKFEKILSIRAILNEEQRAKFNKLKSEKMELHKNRWKKHHSDDEE